MAELLLKAESNAKRILTDNKEELHRLAKGLLKYETLSKMQIDDVLAGKEVKLKTKEEKKKEREKEKGLAAKVA